MAFTGAAFVDTDLTTVLLDLHDATGANNSSYGSVITKFALGGSLRFQVPHEADRFQIPGGDGAFTTFSRRGLATAEWRQVVTATSEANLRLGYGRLVDIITRGGILRLVAGSTRYLRFEPSPFPAAFAGKELELHDIYQAFAFRQGLDITLACQPYLEGAEVTVTGVTVPNDPATSTKVRVFPVAGVTGDLPTPAKVRVQMDTGATVEKILIAHRARNTRAASYFADYLSDTGFVQLEATAANRGWTGTHGTNTSATTDANASPGSGNTIARVTHATNPTVMARRTRHTRTTKVDSVRGAWDVWLRCKAAAARPYEVQLRWGPSTADPVPFSNEVVVHDTSAAAAFGYVELNLGRIYIPEEATLGGLALEVWTRQQSGTAANLDLDLLWLVPAEDQGTVVVAGGSSAETLGEELTTPPYKLTADPTWVAGTVSGSDLLLDAVNEGGGVGPNTGTTLATGRHWVTFSVNATTFAGSTAKFRVVSVGGGGAGSEIVAKSFTTTVPSTVTVEFDAAGGTVYQPQVVLTASGGGRLFVRSVTDGFVASLAANEYARTDPGRVAVDRLDSSGNLSGYLGLEGELPAVLDPGDNHIMVRADEVALANYNENENKLTRTPTVSVIYSPRYGL